MHEYIILALAFILMAAFIGYLFYTESPNVYNVDYKNGQLVLFSINGKQKSLRWAWWYGFPREKSPPA